MVTILCTVRNCRRPLVRESRRMVCGAGHSFDLARSGYCNLLQPQDRRARVPGDSSTVVEARRRFLDRDASLGLAEPLVEAARSIGIFAESAILDSGCGIGFHLDRLKQATGAESHGTDISTAAIDLAARRYPHCQWTIANADRFLPYQDDSFDLAMSITARLYSPELARVVRPGGHLLVTVPAPDDLRELREIVMPGGAIERDRVERTVRMFHACFTLVRHERVRVTSTLDAATLTHLMTSSYRGARLRESERMNELETMAVTLSRDLLLFRR